MHPTFACTQLPCFVAGDMLMRPRPWRAAEESTGKVNTNHLALLHAAAAGQPPANRRLHLGRAHHPRRRRLHLRAARSTPSICRWMMSETVQGRRCPHHLRPLPCPHHRHPLLRPLRRAGTYSHRQLNSGAARTRKKVISDVSVLRKEARAIPTMRSGRSPVEKCRRLSTSAVN